MVHPAVKSAEMFAAAQPRRRPAFSRNGNYWHELLLCPINFYPLLRISPKQV